MPFTLATPQTMTNPITPPPELVASLRNSAPHDLRAARRPKPPSLKEQAMKALDDAVYMADDIPPEGISTDQANIIRRALEALDD